MCKRQKCRALAHPPRRRQTSRMVYLRLQPPLCVDSFTDLRSLVSFRTLTQVMTSAATIPIPTHDTQMTGSTGKLSLQNIFTVSLWGRFCSVLFRAWVSPAKSYQHCTILCMLLCMFFIVAPFLDPWIFSITVTFKNYYLIIILFRWTRNGLPI